MSNFMQGFYKPQNPKKYEGNIKNIVYRSSWELTMFRKVDIDPDVIAWSSESVIIPYTDKATGRLHRYFVDLKVVKKQPDNTVKTFLIEIKPFSQTQEPKRGKKKEKTFLKEVMTYGKNTGKWEAAQRYCAKKGWTFVILTERDMKGSFL